MAAGETVEAARCFREAFKLTLNHPEVAEAYIAVLDRMNAYGDILWAADQYARGSRRGTPRVEAKIGVARKALHRWVLDFVGIPVEHGAYVRSVVVTGLERGERKTLALPLDMLRNWRSQGTPLYVQLKFENIYDGLRIEALRYRRPGEPFREMELDEGQVAYLHRAHSGAEYHAEIRTDLDLAKLDAVEVVYSCPEHRLSSSLDLVIEKARANFEAGK